MVERKMSPKETLQHAAQRERSHLAFRRTERLPRRSHSYVIASSAQGIPERSRTTGLVFQAILGAAACLALVGVVASTQDAATALNPTSPDAPPPAVFVQLD